MREKELRVKKAISSLYMLVLKQSPKKLRDLQRHAMMRRPVLIKLNNSTHRTNLKSQVQILENLGWIRSMKIQSHNWKVLKLSTLN